MTIPILLIILALVLVSFGAHFLVEGSSRIASRFGISDMVIGMTVVAIGTSMPEMVTSFLGAMRGSAGIAVGNVVGSNICNILLIIGLSALIYPLSVTKENINRDLMFVLLSTAALLIISFDSQVDTLTIDDNMEFNFITRSDGILLLMFFAVFMFYSVVSAKRGGGELIKETPDDEDTKEDKPAKKANIWLSLLMVAVGLTSLIWGGNLLVNNAIILAQHAGVSDVVIGSTIVAIGTSLPELAASVVAAIRKKVGMALGNVVGSNIFNVFLILGGSAVISPLPLNSINHIHFIFLLVATLLLLLAARTSMKIRRSEGAFLLLFYAFYIVVNIAVK